MAVKPIPDEYPRVSPYLIVNDAGKTIDFVKEVFGAKEIERMTLKDGTINHAEVKIGDSVIMLSQASENYPALPAMLYIYVKDTDAAYKRALKAGAKSVMEPADQFYGDRSAGVRDSNGIQWWMASHAEDVSKEEMQRRNVERAKSKGN